MAATRTVRSNVRPSDTRRLAAAVALMELRDPGADRYRAGLTNDDVYVEVWREGHAAIWMIYEEGDERILDRQCQAAPQAREEG